MRFHTTSMLGLLLSLLARQIVAQQLSLHVTIAPRFDSFTQTVTALDCTLELNDIQARADRPLLRLALNHGPTPTLRYDGKALMATDSRGPLPLSYTDTNATDAERTWTSTRDPVGPVVVRFLATPRTTNSSVPSGPRIDLREDQGGAIGMATGFIPYPPAEEDWEISIRWKVPVSAPAGLHVVSSLGDGPDTSAVGHPSTVLEKVYVAAGFVQRWPSLENADRANSADRNFAMYWIGALPYNTTRVGAIVKCNFLAVSQFFSDYDSPFRVFWRQTWVGYGGAGGYQSFLMEYSNGTEEEQSEEALANLLAHETIHSYALMYPTRSFDMWYREGVAVYYAVVAPYLGGAVDRQYLIRWLNNNAQTYYTSSTTGMAWQDVLDHYWQGVELVKTPYSRGFIYLATVQGLIATATNGTKGLEDLVLELYRRYVAREKCQSEEFVHVLAGLVGREKAEASFAAMTNGTLLIPPLDSFAKFGLRLVRKDAEKLEMGFNILSSRVSGLISGSRAELAGIKEGDLVARTWALWGAGDSLDNLMRVVVIRDGQEVAIDYWPRGFDKVENWVWEDSTQHSQGSL